MHRELTSIVILGNDLEAWMAVTILAAQNYKHRPEIRMLTAVEGAVNDNIQSPLPSFTQFLELVGIGTELLAASCQAIPRLGTSYHLPKTNFNHVWGEYGANRGAIEFSQLATRMVHAGLGVDLNQLSIAAQAIAHKKYAHPVSDPTSILSTFKSSISFSTQDFIRVLKARAHSLGVIVDDRNVESVVVNNHAVIVQLAGAELIATYAVNTSPSLKISAPKYESWGRYLPYIRTEQMTTNASGISLAADINLSEKAGWKAKSYVSSAIETIGYEFNATLDPDHEGYSRCCLNPRSDRLLLVGKAAINLASPLVSEADLAWVSLRTMLKYFPSSVSSSAVNREYNQIVYQTFKNVRDLTQLLFDVAGEQADSAWSKFDNILRSEEVLHKRALFTCRGRIPFYEYELIKLDWQVWLLLGLGVLPKHIDPIAISMSIDETVQVIDSVKAAVNRTINTLPEFI
jgi:tryptophan halogenase